MGWFSGKSLALELSTHKNNLWVAWDAKWQAHSAK